MWSVVLKILSILGIILLLLAAFALVILLLILFWPVSYRGGGSAQAGKYRVWFRFRWLFGLLRGAYVDPEDGFRVKLLWMTVYDSGRKHGDEASEDRKSVRDRDSGEKARSRDARPKQPPREAERDQSENIPADKAGQSLSGSDNVPTDDPGEPTLDRSGADAKKEGESSVGREAEQRQTLPEKSSQWKERLRFWLDIIQDGDNQELVKHGCTRLYKIIKSLRPRFLRAEVLVGLGEPDLTGYAYGGYWAVKPFLGKKCQVAVTPDFERKILEGELALGGRVMAVTVVHHVVRVLLDRRLRRLLNKLKSQN